MLTLPCLVNLLAAALFLGLRHTRLANAAPPWLSRFLLTLGLGYGTAAALLVVAGEYSGWPGQGTSVLTLYAAISIAIAAATRLQRRDVFPLTLLAGSWIAISTAWLAHAMRLNDIGELFVIAIWLIASSTIAGTVLMRWMRQWRAPTNDGVTS